jgi:hypothetical protein
MFRWLLHLEQISGENNNNKNDNSRILGSDHHVPALIGHPPCNTSQLVRTQQCTLKIEAHLWGHRLPETVAAAAAVGPVAAAGCVDCCILLGGPCILRPCCYSCPCSLGRRRHGSIHLCRLCSPCGLTTRQTFQSSACAPGASLCAESTCTHICSPLIFWSNKKI